MVCANCMMSHTPAVNGNTNSYRNVADIVNCVWLAHFPTQNSVYHAGYLCQLNYILYYCCKREHIQLLGRPRYFGL